MSARRGPTSSACSSGSSRLPRSSGRRSIWPCPPPTPPSARSPSTRRGPQWRRSTPPSSGARSRSMAEEKPPEPSAEERELVEQLQAELSRLKVSDLLLQTVYTISSLGYHRLSGENKDLEQARLAIEALKALMPVLEGAIPTEAVRDFNQVLVNMQLAYASAAEEGTPEKA